MSDRLTTKEAAEIAGMSPRTLGTMRHYKTGPAYLKVGGRVYYHRKDLALWLVSKNKPVRVPTKEQA